MQPPRRRPLLGVVLLLLAATIWGFAFVPQKMTVTAMPPLSATGLRFALAVPLVLLPVLFRRRQPAGPWPIRVGIGLGVLLYLAFAFQTAALKSAPTARVALLTGLYAVFVPFVAPLFGAKRPTALHVAGALIAFFGLAGLTASPQGESDVSTAFALTRGDVYTLIHALVSAVFVSWVGQLASADVWRLNAVQVSTMATLGLLVAFIVEGDAMLTASLNAQAWAAFGFLALFSTVIAFALQLTGQKHLSAATSSVLMMIETPIGVLCTVLLLNEQMSWLTALAAVIMLAGVLLSIWADQTRAVET